MGDELLCFRNEKWTIRNLEIIPPAHFVRLPPSPEGIPMGKGGLNFFRQRAGELKPLHIKNADFLSYTLNRKSITSPSFTV